jgi:rhodanese-related sulfurtransferase/Fe-S cluster biogenesis protein NfuA
MIACVKIEPMLRYIIMFNKKTEELKDEVTLLKAQLRDVQKEHEKNLKILKEQVAKLASGQSVSPQAVLEGTQYNTVPAQELDGYLIKKPNALVLDVRTDGEWKQGHIEGAMHISINELEQRLGQLQDKDREILVICEHGPRAAAACHILLHHGYTNVANVAGGYSTYTGQLVLPGIKPLNTEGVPGDPALVKEVAAYLDVEVRPHLQNDGGDIEFKGIEEGIVKVKFVGACGGCGSKENTLDGGLKSRLVGNFESITGVQEV